MAGEAAETVAEGAEGVESSPAADAGQGSKSPRSRRALADEERQRREREEEGQNNLNEMINGFNDLLATMRLAIGAPGRVSAVARVSNKDLLTWRENVNTMCQKAMHHHANHVRFLFLTTHGSKFWVDVDSFFSSLSCARLSYRTTQLDFLEQLCSFGEQMMNLHVYQLAYGEIYERYTLSSSRTAEERVSNRLTRVTSSVTDVTTGNSIRRHRLRFADIALKYVKERSYTASEEGEAKNGKKYCEDEHEATVRCCQIVARFLTGRAFCVYRLSVQKGIGCTQSFTRSIDFYSSYYSKMA